MCILHFPRPQEIDEAARRRLVKRLYIPLPNAIARKEIVLNLLKEQSFTLSEDDTKNLCESSEGKQLMVPTVVYVHTQLLMYPNILTPLQLECSKL